MSFDNDRGGEMTVGKGTECKPNYEAQAARVKLKLEATGKLKEALFNFIDKSDPYRFKKIASLAEMVGAWRFLNRSNQSSTTSYCGI